MPGTRPNAKRATKPRRPAHRPTKFTADLAERICELVALGWFMKDAARQFGIPPETVCRWVAKHEDFRRAYEQARRGAAELAEGRGLIFSPRSSQLPAR